MNRLRLYGAAIAAVTCGLVDARAQQPIQERLVALSLYVDARRPSYAASSSNVSTVWVDSTEPTVRVVVSIGNNTGQVLEIGSARQDWTQAIRWSVVRLIGASVRQIAPQGVIRNEVPGRVSPRAIAIGRRATAAFVLDTAGVPDRFDGVYELTASFDDASMSPFARRLSNLLTRKVRLEIKQARTSAEMEDAYLQLSYEALGAGRAVDVRSWSQKVLTINPTSIPALADIAGTWLAEGNCRKAIPFLQRSILLLNTGGDADLRVSDGGRQEWSAALRGHLAQCGVG